MKNNRRPLRNNINIQRVSVATRLISNVFFFILYYYNAFNTIILYNNELIIIPGRIFLEVPYIVIHMNIRHKLNINTIIYGRIIYLAAFSRLPHIIIYVYMGVYQLNTILLRRTTVYVYIRKKLL